MWLVQQQISFVKEGTKVKKKKKATCAFWGGFEDWKVLEDTRKRQIQIPPSIASTALRPDICVYSEMAKKVLFIELTSPSEENIQLWKVKKRQKYIGLVEEAKSNGYTAYCRTIEVGARGFVSSSSMNVFSMMGFSMKKKCELRRIMSKVAIRCSHFIWINRNNKQWNKPDRVH